jgi:hypothetical protein
MAESDEPQRPPKPKSISSLESLQLGFMIVSAIGAFFYFRGPAQNDAQLAFRIGVIAVGFIGLLIVSIIRLTRKRRN